MLIKSLSLVFHPSGPYILFKRRDSQIKRCLFLSFYLLYITVSSLICGISSTRPLHFILSGIYGNFNFARCRLTITDDSQDGFLLKENNSERGTMQEQLSLLIRRLEGFDSFSVHFYSITLILISIVTTCRVDILLKMCVFVDMVKFSFRCNMYGKSHNRSSLL